MPIQNSLSPWSWVQNFLSDPVIPQICYQTRFGFWTIQTKQTTQKTTTFKLQCAAPWCTRTSNTLSQLWKWIVQYPSKIPHSRTAWFVSVILVVSLIKWVSFRLVDLNIPKRVHSTPFSSMQYTPRLQRRVQCCFWHQTSAYPAMPIRTSFTHSNGLVCLGRLPLSTIHIWK